MFDFLGVSRPTEENVNHILGKKINASVKQEFSLDVSEYRDREKSLFEAVQSRFIR